MIAMLRNATLSIATLLLLATVATAQETPYKKPDHQDAAIENFQYDNSLSLLLSRKLVSSNDLGVDVGEVQPALQAQLNLPEGTGLAVTGVPAEGPGAAAGLKPHDILLSVGGAKVGNSEQLMEALKNAEGRSVKIEILRQGKPLTLEATPKKPHFAEFALSGMKVTDFDVDGGTLLKLKQEPRYRIGVVLSEADDTLRAQVGLAAGEGLIVTEVFPDTPAAKAGIQPHDVLVILDGKRLSTVDAVNAQIQEIQEREVELKLLRGGKELLLKIAPQKEAAEATHADAISRFPVTIWSAGRCPGQVQTLNSLTCANCHSNLYSYNPNSGLLFPSTWKHGWLGGQNYSALRDHWTLKQHAAAGSPQEQVNQLKEQLAKMQETLSTLEASLAAATAKEETQSRPEKKK
ncbi:MAG TPA: PDZ domain-containing protein [Pirellulaceae bacterium]|nr:PDZ domain-containing protein [Pirellulaceae bacterium]